MEVTEMDADAFPRAAGAAYVDLVMMMKIRRFLFNFLYLSFFLPSFLPCFLWMLL